jgi:hypothetical protein
VLDRDRFVVGDTAWEKVAPLLPGKPTESSVNNAESRGLPGHSRRRQYSRLQGGSPERVKTLQTRSPLEGAAAA